MVEYSSGSGSGYGDGSGSGYGYGSGDGLASIGGQSIYRIDGTPTIITNVRDNIAKGAILNSDLTTTPCYIAKGHNLFAHGETAREAMAALHEKIYESMDPDEAIEAFIKEFADPDKKYPAKDFYVWHHRLTGSCEMGRNAFVKNGGYDIENDTFTISEFIEITRNAYGGDIIRRLEAALEK